MRRLLTSTAAVALCIGGVVLPEAALAVPPAPAQQELCPATQLPLGPDALAPDVPRPPLPPVGAALRRDELAVPGLLVPAGSPAPPVVTATAWVVADLTTGDVLASCNAHVPFAPASTLKVLTALALLPWLDPDAVHTAGPSSAQVGGSRVGVVEGSEYTVDDLAYGLMLGSGNDAAVALGELVGPDVALARMTDTARGLGAVSTVPRTTNGLDAPGQVSTAHDLAVLARAALADPRVAAPASTLRYSFPAAGRVGDPGRSRYEIQTSSRLLRNYEGATGLKSGFTRAAGGSYVGTAERDGRRYVATVMRSQGSAWRHSAQLLDWAFATGGAGGAVGALAAAGDLPQASRARDQDAGDQDAIPAPPSGAPPSDPPPSDPTVPDPIVPEAPEPDTAPTPATDPLDAITGGRAWADPQAAAADGPGTVAQLAVLSVVLLGAAGVAVVVVVLRRRRTRSGGPPDV